MEFRLLGPLEVRHSGEILPVRAPRQRSLLAALLLHANQVVTVDRLIDRVWGQDPPPSAAANLRTHVAALRRNLSRAKGSARVVARSGGYLIVVRPGELDLSAFEELAGQGRAAVQRSEHALAARRFGEALALWHGRPLENVALSGTAEADAVRLSEDRISVLEDCLHARLAAGEHASVIGALRGLVLEHPLREHLWALLMLALYRAGRKADALAAYDDARAQLADQLGLDPGTELCRLHQHILTGDPALSGPKPEPGQLRAVASADRWPAPGTPRFTVTPLQLPPAIADFTGRAAHLGRLDELMAEREDAPKALVITSIAGTAGVGKTALAVHWAHRVRHQFPDGQLYVNLLGHAQSPPLHPEQALGQFLRGLGVPAELVPAGVAEASGMYRSLLADKRMLVVLDNAASPDQVRPLLPASAGCLVVVTSRDRLDGLVARDAARRITVEVMPLDEALALLGRMMGENRICAEPDAAAELATTCACLPLALRIAAAQLASQPDRAIADYVAELGQGNPLVCLEIDGDDHAAVRAAFDLSYAALKPDAQRLFRHLGLLSGPDITVASATDLTNLTRTQAAQLLDHLAAAHLVYQHAPGRYTFHDLLRRYAQARAAGDVDGGKERARGPLGRGDL